ncbi:MAG TPA: rhodanese-like domain-containing protein [Stenomitos sp.]
MSPNVVREKIAAGATIVDVRSPGEYRSGAYPGAINIPLQELPQRLGELSKAKPIVVYCASGGRSAAAAGVMKQAGFSDVVNGGGLIQMPR